jgi:hypothetical protein
VIFTLPHALNPLWLANVSVMTTLLFQAVHDTLCTFLADPQYLGAPHSSWVATRRGRTKPVSSSPPFKTELAVE